MQTYKLGAGDDMLLIDQAEAQTELMMLPSAQPGIDPQKLLKAIYKHPLLGEYEKAVMTEIVDKLQEGEKNE
jgi:hypothetical protein